MGMGAVAGATLAAGALGAGASLYGSSKAAGAAKSAADLQLQQQQRTQAMLQPWVSTGSGVLGDLSSLATGGQFGPGGTDYVSQAAGLAPGAMTESALVQTPGYQFTLGQGLKATQSAAAARGLGVSGAALKGAGTYATGLADQTYQQQFALQQQRFQNALSLNQAQQGNLQNQFSRLQNVASLGENAAAGTGSLGQQAAATAGGDITQAGLAGAAGISGASSAINQGTQNLLGYNILQQAINNQGYGALGGGGMGAGGWAGPNYGGTGPLYSGQTGGGAAAGGA